MMSSKRWIIFACLAAALLALALAAWKMWPAPKAAAAPSHKSGWTVLAHSKDQPAALAAGPDGTLYVTFKGDRNVHAISAQGLHSTLVNKDGQAAHFGPGEALHDFSAPDSIAVDRQGKLYVVDSVVQDGGDVATSVIQVRQPGGAMVSLKPVGKDQRAMRLNHINGLAVGADGTVYASDDPGGPLLRISAAGNISVLAAPNWQEVDGKPTGIRMIQGIALDADNAVVLTDYEHVLYKVMPDGAVHALAGKAGDCGWVDGTGAAARFCELGAVAVAPNGDAYVAEHSCRVRKITRAGVVTTLFSNPDEPRAGVPALPVGLCPLSAIAVGGRGELYLAGKSILRLNQ